MLANIAAQSLKEISEEYSYMYDSNFLFLNSTIVSGMKTNSRKSISYFSPRRWRKDLKSQQILSLRNLKMQPHEKSIQVAALQVAELASTITNGKPYSFVTNIPGGTSGRRWNFAAMIAFFVGTRRSLPGGVRREFNRPLPLEPSEAERMLSPEI